MVLEGVGPKNLDSEMATIEHRGDQRVSDKSIKLFKHQLVLCIKEALEIRTSPKIGFKNKETNRKLR